MASLPIRLSAGTLNLEVDRRGSGRPLLLLHGGAGPASMLTLFAALDGFELVLPTHPGFDVTEHPSWVTSIEDLARCYVTLLDALNLRNVIVVGNSFGGWIAAEMAVRQSSTLAGIILIDAVGLEPTESTGPIADPRSIPVEELIKLSFADPAKARPPGPDAAAQRQANQRVLMSYASEPFMYDPTLAERLSCVAVPSLILWGRDDGVITPEYGQEYTRRIPGGRFQTIDSAGHLPQIEQPEETAQAIRDFVGSLSRAVPN